MYKLNDYLFSVCCMVTPLHIPALLYLTKLVVCRRIFYFYTSLCMKIKKHMLPQNAHITAQISCYKKRNFSYT